MRLNERAEQTPAERRRSSGAAAAPLFRSSERRAGARISRGTVPGIDEFTMTTPNARVADASGDFLLSGVGR
jgi:hypothetical protein